MTKKHDGLVRASEVLLGLNLPEPAAPVPKPLELTVIESSNRTERRVDGAIRIQKEREAGVQNIGYLARPFLLCGLPFKRPPKAQLIYRRTNGDEVLDIKADPEFG